jgi:OTU-like cysteine protease/DDE superfamily endonuclease
METEALMIETNDRSLLELVDVPGDGNCFFHAVALSEFINMSNHEELRSFLAERVSAVLSNPSEHKDVLSLFTHASGKTKLTVWLDCVKKVNNWGDDRAALFIAYFFQVNIRIISNMERGFFYNDIRLWAQLHGHPIVSNEAPTIHLYHYLYARATTPSKHCNHFGYLRQVQQHTGQPVYRGAEVQDHVLPSDGSKDIPIELLGDEETLVPTPDIAPTSTKRKQSSLLKTFQRQGATKYVQPKRMKKEEARKLTKAEAQAEKKKYKDSVLLNYVAVMPINTEEVERLESLRLTKEQLVEEKKKLDALVLAASNIDDKDPCIDGVDWCDDSAKAATVNGKLGVMIKKQQFTWEERAHLVAFHLHPFFGNKDYHTLKVIFKVPQETMKKWVQRADYIAKWLPFVKVMTIRNILNGIPVSYKDLYVQKMSIAKGTKHFPTMTQFDLHFYESRTKHQQQYLVFLRNDRSKIDIGAHNKCIGDSTGTTIGTGTKESSYITLKRKSFAPGRPNKYTGAIAFVKDLVESRWNDGNPLSKTTLYGAIREKFLSNNCEFDLGILRSKNYPNSLHKFVTRALKAIDFTCRKSSIAQKVPDNWKDLATAGAERARALFRNEQVEVVLAADETFLKFHERDTSLLVPRGVKRVGSAAKLDEKDGCTLMVTMDMSSSQLIPPFLIFKGVFGANLMREWSKYKGATVLFTEKHWQTSATVIIYLESLRKMYHHAGKKVIGLIWDKASSHNSEEVVTYLNESNQRCTPKIVVEFVDAGMTVVYQPPDVVINKPLKAAVRLQYEALMAARGRAQNFIPGGNVSVSREELVKIVECAYKSINEHNRLAGKDYIRRSFEMCGLDPWVNDDHVFQQHLDRLSENGIYKSLLEKNFDRSIGSK